MAVAVIVTPEFTLEIATEPPLNVSITKDAVVSVVEGLVIRLTLSDKVVPTTNVAVSGCEMVSTFEAAVQVAVDAKPLLIAHGSLDLSASVIVLGKVMRTNPLASKASAGWNENR